MKIGPRPIGLDQPPYVIAEVGVNHDGDINRAVELINAAKATGADAVKFQYFDTAHLLSRAALLADYQSSGVTTSAVELLDPLQLDYAAMQRIVDRAHTVGIAAIVTVFSSHLIEQINQLNWDAYKVASPDMINKPLIDALRATNKPLIVSTGAATLFEVTRAAGWLGDHPTAFLQCVSAYPTPDFDANLNAIASIRGETGTPVGYSDHTTATDTGGLAVAAGACILEKHFTHNRNAPGPDHAASLEQNQLSEYIAFAHRAWKMRGAAEKHLLPVEHEVRQVSRQSITTARCLEEGEVIAEDDLTIKRPGSGIEPWRIEEVIGKTTTRRVEIDTPMTTEDVA